MPTGYTAGVGDGTVKDFRVFALECARNFGALIVLRDEPEKPIPDKLPISDYAERSLAEARADLEAAMRMTLDEAETAATKEYEERVESDRKYAEARRRTRENYEAMLEKVRAWIPPTKDHIELRDFMVSQLTQSIEFDCADYSSKPIKLSGSSWRDKRRSILRETVSRRIKDYQDEAERNISRQGWIDALRKSLETI